VGVAGLGWVAPCGSLDARRGGGAESGNDNMKVLAAAIVAAVVGSATAFGPNCATNKDAVLRGTPVYNGPLVPNLKVAFIGDTGDSDGQRNVLELIKAQGAEAVFHAGDSSYDNAPGVWNAQIDDVLGANYPYFLSIGNHDNLAFSVPGGYQELLLRRMESNNGTSYCDGEIGITQRCNYKGIYIAMSGVGSRATPEAGTAFLDNAFREYPNIWRVAMWHKNQLLYQTGGKLNGVGWGVYQTSLAHGAIVATGHEHSYSRTHLMSDYEQTEIASTSNTLVMQPGRSFCFVSGIGGRGIRGWERDLNENPWWAAAASSDNGVSNGALFCTFNVDGNPRSAFCELRDITNRIWDAFFVESNNTAVDAAAHNTANKVHLNKHHEVSVASSADDVHVHVESGEVDHSNARLSLGGENEARLTFRNVPVHKAAQMESVHLQVLGASSLKNPSMLIRAVIPGLNRLTQAAAVWDTDEEDFEANTVWTSPDLLPLLKEIAYLLPNRDLNTVTLVIGGHGGASVYSFDHGECFAPTLAYEL
jgi:hypothetical protein